MAVLSRAALAGGAVFLSSGCSTPADCSPPISEGVRYQVTLGMEMMGTPEVRGSSRCYIVDPFYLQTFEVKAGKAQPAPHQPTCSVTPAAEPPPQRTVVTSGCTGSTSEMLGTDCQLTYATQCKGSIKFYFSAAPGATVDWTAPVIENAVFHIEDISSQCLSAPSDCHDKYMATLRRIN